MKINKQVVIKILGSMNADSSGNVCAKTFLEKLCFEYQFVRKFCKNVIR